MFTYTGHPDWTMEILDDNTFGMLEYHGADTIVTIPSDVCGKKVTKICDEAFSTWKEDISWEDEFRLRAIEKVIIPDTVKTIGFEAFAECTNLSEVVLPETITSIGMLAFRNCYRLNKINIPEECQIEDGAFLNCDCIEHARIGIKEREFFSL